MPRGHSAELITQLCCDWSFHMYVTGSGGMLYCNQTLFLSRRVGSGHKTTVSMDIGQGEEGKTKVFVTF